MSVTMLTVNDLVDKALEEAPRFSASELPKVASFTPKKTTAIDLANSLEKLAGELEKKENADLVSFQYEKTEKKASIEEIVKTYIELETSR